MVSSAGLVFGLPRRWYPTKGPARGLIRSRIGAGVGCAVSSGLASNSGAAVWGCRESTIGTIGQGTMAKVSPFKFLQEVRQEVAKITWPSRRETTITTVMVFVFSVAAAVFFLMADQVIRMVVTLVLGIGS